MISTRRSIHDTFASLHQRGQLALGPFIPAGYPDLATTAAALPALEAGGANLIEIGFPFSDPIADGPVIQEAFTAALANRITVAEVFAVVREARPNVSIPLLGMLSYSIVFRYGLDRFLAEAKAAGLDGLILPDLPPPEAQAICARVRAAGLDTVLLVAPTTTAQRRREIAALSSGFIYYLSVSGITGERDRLPADLEQNIRDLKSLTDRPICVGFGIAKPEHIDQLTGVADGAMIGSALVKRMKPHLQDGPKKLSDVIGGFVTELRGGSR
jgi:tryptophan synthase alpha chain